MFNSHLQVLILKGSEILIKLFDMMFKHLCKYSVGMGNLFFPLLICVTGTLVWCGEGCWNI